MWNCQRKTIVPCSVVFLARHSHSVVHIGSLQWALQIMHTLVSLCTIVIALCILLYGFDGRFFFFFAGVAVAPRSFHSSFAFIVVLCLFCLFGSHRMVCSYFCFSQNTRPRQWKIDIDGVWKRQSTAKARTGKNEIKEPKHTQQSKTKKQTLRWKQGTRLCHQYQMKIAAFNCGAHRFRSRVRSRFSADSIWLRWQIMKVQVNVCLLFNIINFFSPL